MLERKLPLLYKVLVIMIVVSILPLATLGLISVDRSSRLGEYAINDAEESGDFAVERSKEALLKLAASDLQSKSNMTAEMIYNIMETRIDSIISMSLLPTEAETYLKFSEMNTGPIHDPHDERTIDVEHDVDNVIESPIYREIIFVDVDGDVQINIGSTGEVYESHSILENSDNVMEYSDEADVFQQSLKQTFVEVTTAPDDLIGKVFVANTTITAADGNRRNTNLIANPIPPDDTTNRFTDGVIRCGTPIYSQGTFQGVLVVDINWLHVMKEVNDFQFGSEGYAYLQEITGEVADQVQASPSTNVSNVLPDGTVIEYGETMEDIHLGLTLAHPQHNFVSFMDPTALGIPTLTYLGSKQHQYEYGIGRYIFDDVDKWTAYAPIIVDTDKTVNMNDWSIATTSPVEEFMEPAEQTEQNLVERNEATTQNIENRIDDLRMLIYIFTITALIISILAAIFLSNYITRPIRKLTKMADKVSKGSEELNEVEISTNDEIGELAISFNRMISSLKLAMNMLEDEDR